MKIKSPGLNRTDWKDSKKNLRRIPNHFAELALLFYHAADRARNGTLRQVAHGSNGVNGAAGGGDLSAAWRKYDCWKRVRLDAVAFSAAA